MAKPQISGTFVVFRIGPKQDLSIPCKQLASVAIMALFFIKPQILGFWWL